jgi:hypothetical protein
MKKASLRLQVEELEGRTLMSGTPVPPPVLGPALTATAAAHTVVHLGGTFSGRYATSNPIPDAGTTYRLTATGSVGTLGTMSVTGVVNTPGFVVSGRATGFLTLSNSHGSVTLRLVGPVEKGFGPLPEHFTFTVDHGTRAYEHCHMSGTINLSLRPIPAHSARHAKPPTNQGTFTLSIHEKPPHITTGIAGVVVEGPISLVIRRGVPNTRPVPGAVISVQLTSGGPEIARQKADSQGKFQLALEPGVYFVVAISPQPWLALPRGIPQIVVVAKGHVSDVTLPMDTGIV